MAKCIGCGVAVPGVGEDEPAVFCVECHNRIRASRPTLTLTRARLEELLRSVAEYAGRAPTGDPAGWYENVDAHIAAALAEIEKEQG